MCVLLCGVNILRVKSFATLFILPYSDFKYLRINNRIHKKC